MTKWGTWTAEFLQGLGSVPGTSAYESHGRDVQHLCGLQMASGTVCSLSSSPQDHSKPALLCCQPQEMSLFFKLMLLVLSLTVLPSCPLLLLSQVLSVK